MTVGTFGPPRGVLLDIDGTLLTGDRPISGAQAALRAIRESTLPLAFATNTTRMSAKMVVDLMHRTGLEVHIDELVTAPRVAAAELARSGIHRVFPLVAGCCWEDLGRLEFVDLVRQGEGRLEGQIEASAEPAEVEAVVLGDLGEELCFGHLNQAFRAILSGARFMALHRNRFWRVSDGLQLDAGAFVAALEYATGVSAQLVGKPSALFYRSALAVLNAIGGTQLAPETVWMVGDDFVADIEGGRRAGLRTCLVRTGKYRAEDIGTGASRPDVEIESVADLPSVLGLG